MALEGQLSDFNLAEILQLIASQEKCHQREHKICSSGILGFVHDQTRFDMLLLPQHPGQADEKIHRRHPKFR